MALPKLEINDIAFDSGTEADTVNFEVLAIALADAMHHVGNETLSGSVHGTHFTIFVQAGDQDFFALRDDGDAFRKVPVELALGALNVDRTVCTDFNGDFVRDGDGLFTDS
jgi:hypothetical protein